MKRLFRLNDVLDMPARSADALVKLNNGVAIVKIRITAGRIKYGGQYYHAGELVHVDNEAGDDLVARGVAAKVRRSTRVRLQPEALDTRPDDSERTK